MQTLGIHMDIGASFYGSASQRCGSHRVSRGCHGAGNELTHTRHNQENIIAPLVVVGIIGLSWFDAVEARGQFRVMVIQGTNGIARPLGCPSLTALNQLRKRKN
jgi:hypothetical protein